MSKTLTLASLTDPREAAFVAALFALGGPAFGTEAAIRAGFATNPDDGSRAAAFLMSSPRIAKVIVGEVRHRFDIAASTAFNTLLEVCSDRRAPATARISAAESILNRSAIGPVPSRSMVLTARTNVEELLEQLDERERGGEGHAAPSA